MKLTRSHVMAVQRVSINALRRQFLWRSRKRGSGIYPKPPMVGFFMLIYTRPRKILENWLLSLNHMAQEEMEVSGAELMLIDGPPGIGCPVISAVSGATEVLVVTEPSLAGLHDLGRVLETTAHFDVRVTVCINKADIYPEGVRKIRKFCQEKKIECLGDIPYDLAVPQAMVEGQPVTLYDPQAPSSQAIKMIWEKLLVFINQTRGTKEVIQI